MVADDARVAGLVGRCHLGFGWTMNGVTPHTNGVVATFIVG